MTWGSIQLSPRTGIHGFTSRRLAGYWTSQRPRAAKEPQQKACRRFGGIQGMGIGDGSVIHGETWNSNFLESRPTNAYYIPSCLVVWLPFFIFAYIGISSSQLTNIFFRAVQTTNQQEHVTWPHVGWVLVVHLSVSRSRFPWNRYSEHTYKWQITSKVIVSGKKKTNKNSYGITTWVYLSSILPILCIL